MNEHDKLRKALGNARDWSLNEQGARMERFLTTEDLAALCFAAESTLPKTKMVEVWRLEFWDEAPCINQRGSYEEAMVRKSEIIAYGRARCIRVTGPHQQEVPA